MTHDLIDRIRVQARRRPNAIAVVDGARTRNFAALIDHIDRAAAAICRMIPEGATIAILAPNCLEFPELILAGAAAGRPAVMMNIRLAPAELLAIAEDMRIELLFVHPDYTAVADTFANPAVMRIELGSGYDAWLAEYEPLPPRSIDPESTALIGATGGTTGRAKGVILSHRSRVAMFDAMAEAFECYTDQDRTLVVSPMFHGAGFNFSLATIMHGGTAVMLPKFDAAEALRLLDSERITVASLVPTHMVAMTMLPETAWEGKPLATLKTLISNAAKLPGGLRIAMTERVGAGVLCEAYGSTEAGIVTLMLATELFERAGSCGRLFPHVAVRVVDEHGSSLSAGAEGEIVVRTPSLFSGYVGQEAHSPDRWFVTGDIGWLDPDGYLHLVDRKDEKIITGGINVYPAEVEQVLADHPAVAEVAVFGIEDAYWGEAIHAAVTLMPGQRTNGAELGAFVQRSLGRYKTPRQFEFVEALPKSAAGKVLRRAARDQWRARQAERA